MLLKQKLIILSLLICSLTNTYAQKDYVVTLKKDTLWGTIKRHDTDILKFLPVDSAKSIKYAPGQIISFYAKEDSIHCYKSIKIPQKDKDLEEELRFLPRIETGKIDLFEWVSRGYRSVAISWYATKGEKEVVEVKSNQIFGSRRERKNAIYLLIKDNEALVEKFIDDDKFSFEQVRELIKQYNLEKKS